MYSDASLIKIIDTSNKLPFLSILFITAKTSSAVELNTYIVFRFLGNQFEKPKLDPRICSCTSLGQECKYLLNDKAIIAGLLVSCLLMTNVRSALCFVWAINSMRSFQFFFGLLFSKLNLSSNFNTSFKALQYDGYECLLILFRSNSLNHKCFFLVHRKTLEFISISFLRKKLLYGFVLQFGYKFNEII